MKIRLVSIFFIFTGVILAENYRPPNMEKELFKVKKLAITEIGKTSLFNTYVKIIALKNMLYLRFNIS